MKSVAFHPLLAEVNKREAVDMAYQPDGVSWEMMIWIGVDPGQSGGIAAVTGPGQAEAWPMPRTERDIWDLFRSLADRPGPKTALIERVHSMPRQGVASTFKFGTSYGMLRMALIASGIPFDEITPPKWQQLMGCRSGGDKNVTKQRAQQLFPYLRITHATADAVLLAELCRRTYNVS